VSPRAPTEPMSTPDVGVGVHDNDDDFFAGVPSSAEDLYGVLLFFLALFVVGDVFCRRVIRIVPPLVGHILVGITFGPQGFNWVQPSPPETWVLLGNLGLLLLILQAGLEMDYKILKMVGLRGVIIAIVGSILPISIGTAIASVYLKGWKSALAAGSSFGPTSAGIAMKVLGQCHVLQRPVGQLIIAAAIVDDILALVILSQLQALTTEDPSLKDILIPIISAILWLFVGGAIALYVAPTILPKVLSSLRRGCGGGGGGGPTNTTNSNDNNSNSNTQIEDSIVNMTILFALLFALLPATYYTKASYLLGAFLTGLAFCQDSTGVDALYRQQFKRIIQWLMKIFFAATIGFQVPVRSFVDGTILARGCFFVVSLLGKFAVGSLTPIFDKQYNDVDVTNNNKNNNNNDGGEQHNHNLVREQQPQRRYRGRHLRDCLVVGFSMMGEAEFAFVVAVFGVTEGLVPPDVYASIVLAILLSTVISPLLLRTTLAISPYDDDDDDHNDDDNQNNNNDTKKLEVTAAITRIERTPDDSAADDQDESNNDLRNAESSELTV
jgi:Kef-type K+ transport system membrane component KefB